MIAFPKKVILPDQEVIVQSPEEFLTYYDEILLRILRNASINLWPRTRFGGITGAWLWEMVKFG